MKRRGRPPGSFSPWNRIAIGDRFYSRLAERAKREGRRSVYDTLCELYKEDHPDDIRIRDKERFARYCENIRKLARRGRSEEQAMTEGHWDEWFQARRRRRHRR